jgi:solute carrier family 45, member 1/2/4
MTGFAALPIAESGGSQDNDTHLVGTSKVLGPAWLQLPAITVGLLGVQMLWSVEMSYGTSLPHSL